MLAEIDAEWNGIDIHEHRLLAVVRYQPIEDAAGHRLGVRTTVRDDDLGHGFSPAGRFPSGQ
jgi:hypothetical protein